MDFNQMNWAVVVPMANEERDFGPFVTSLERVLDQLGSGTAYFVVDNVSTDATLDLCRNISARDFRFVTVWAPETRHLADAYLRGLKEAFERGHKFIIEMDAGLSHDPHAIPTFLKALNDGYECALGSRYASGGCNRLSPWCRQLLSRSGTFLARLLLGIRLSDSTSGFQGFSAAVVQSLLAAEIRSTAHFYQTEVRYLVRKRRAIEVPIRYRAPSPRVSFRAIRNAILVLIYYVWRRITLRSPVC